MPELPEVEAARVLVERGCKGKRILKATVADDTTVIDGCTPAELQKALEGRTLVRARRKGKYLWLELDRKGPWPLLHFGMTGGIVVQGMGVMKYKRAHLESDPDVWPPKYTKMELELEGGGKLAFVDARRFARIKLLEDPPSKEPLSRLGFDVHEQLPATPADFAKVLRKRVERAPRTKIKALLLDQEFCSGIGNWVGDEVLYQAKIHPEQFATSLDDTALAALHGAIRSVVGLAVEVEADSARFPKEWLFHYRWTNKKAGNDSLGRAIEFVTVGSRTSAFVPAIQILTGDDAGGGGAKAGAKAGGKRGKKAAKEEAEKKDDGGDGEAKDEVEETGKAPAKRRKKADGKPAAEAAEPAAEPAAGAAEAAAPKATSGGQKAKKGKQAEAEEGQEESKEQQQEEQKGEEEDKGGKKREKDGAAKKAGKKAGKEAGKDAVGDGEVGKAAAPRGRKSKS